MIISFNPYPENKIIVKSLFSRFSSRNFFNKFHSRNKLTFYSRASWALYFGIIKSLKDKNVENGNVWFPSYFCNEALIPLRNKNITIKFYPIKKNLKPDWKNIEEEINLNANIDVFILVHFFGITSSVKKANIFCKNNNITLIQDCAHLLKPLNHIKENIYIYSPRKLFSLPDIGILITNKSLSNKQYFDYNNKIFFYWFLKFFIKKIFSILNINWYNFNSNKIINSKTFLSKNKFTTKFNIKILKHYENNLNLYTNLRRRNYFYFKELISNIKGVIPLFNKIPNECVPYVFPLLILKNYSLIKLELMKKGIPVTSWPDLPPEINNLNKKFSNSIWLRNHLLLFPIHQSINLKEIDYIFLSLKKITEKID